MLKIVAVGCAHGCGNGAAEMKEKIMAFRDYYWYLDRYTEQQKMVELYQEEVDKAIHMAEYSSAVLHCDTLKVALITLNDLANRMADKMP